MLYHGGAGNNRKRQGWGKPLPAPIYGAVVERERHVRRPRLPRKHCRCKPCPPHTIFGGDAVIIRAKDIRMRANVYGDTEITLTTEDRRIDISRLKEAASKGKLLAAEIKQHRRRRSLDANAYLWVLLGKIAEVLQTDKDEIYLLMLERYGVFTHVIVKPQVVEQVKQQWRTVRELGKVTVNGKTGIQLQCYFGSSTYDTKQMATLIDGVVGECQELGIDTLPPDQIQVLKEKWGDPVRRVIA